LFGGLAKQCTERPVEMKRRPPSPSCQSLERGPCRSSRANRATNVQEFTC
jgi:hypothetical protein